MKSLVLDLRSDPGGLRDEAVQAADLFLDPRPGHPREPRAGAGRQPPLDRRGAAALARAAARGAGERRHGERGGDHRRARCRTTTARWSWATRPTARGSSRRCSRSGTDVALRITTARWYTPSGRSIQGATLDSVMGAAHPAATRRPIARTAGRPLAGGGGIVPDVLLEPDTLTHGGAAASRGRSTAS